MRILLILMLSSSMAWAQSTIGIIPPGGSHTNNNTYKEYFLPESKIIDFLNLKTQSEMDSLRILKYQELTKNYEERIYLADSTTSLLRIESQIWHSKLQQNDLLLEEEKKVNIHLRDENQRIRRSRIYYMLAGVVATSIVFIAIK